jgi:uncharacterized protein
MNIVLDTNVLVSGLINPDGNPAKILNLILNNELVVLYDVRILDEYNRVLRRDKFGFTEDIIKPFIDFIESEGISITPNPSSLKFKDEDDKKFYEVAISGNANYLITGNKSHFPKEKIVISQTELLLKIGT